jgi:hypothetical protein
MGTPGECYHGDWLLGRPPDRTNRAEVVNVNGYATFRQVRMYNESNSILGGGARECGTRSLILGGTTGIGVGVRARLPFRVFTVASGRAGGWRLVIDVAHHW